MDVEPRAWIALGMLVGATVADLRTRRVASSYWLPFSIAAAAFVVADAASMDRITLAWTYGIALVLCAMFYLLWRVHAFGGADAKALMVLAFLVPGDVHGVPTVLVAVLVGSLGIVLMPVVLALTNLARGHVRLPVMVLGTTMDLDEARRRNVWPMQDVVDGKLVWRYWRMVGVDAHARIDRLRAAGLASSWVTPKIPYLAFVGLGLAATLLADPLAWLLPKTGQ